MTNRIELNWTVDGVLDEQRYYCSETPIDVDNLPVPKVVLAGDVRSYVDTAIEDGKTYYFCIGSVKFGIEKLSKINMVLTTLYSAYYPLTVDYVDLITGESFTPTGSTISSAGAYFTGASQASYATKADSAATTLGAGDFTLEIEFKSDRVVGSSEVLVDNYQGGSTSWQLMLNGSGQITIYNNGYLFATTTTYLDGQYHHVAIVRKNNISKLLVDGVVVTEFTFAAVDLATLTNFTIGSQSNNKTYPYKGWLRNLKICHFARYSID